MRDLDSLKALASLFIVINHACYNRLFDPLASAEALQVIEQWRAFSLAYVPVRVPLFFLIAGIFTINGIQTYTVNEYFRRRFLRVLIPFVVGVMTFAFLVDSINQKAWESGPLLSVYLSFINPFGPHGYAHLWFLFSLITLSLFTLLLSPIVKRSTPILNIITGCRDLLMRHQLIFLVCLIGFEVVKIFARSSGVFDALNISGKLPLGDTLWGANYFFLGLLLGSNRAKLRSFLSVSLLPMAVAVAGLAGLGIAGHFCEMRLPFVMYSAGANIVPLLLLLALFHQCFNVCSEPLKSMSAYSYPVFMLHMPIISVMTLIMLNSGIAVLPGFFLVLLLCYPLSIGLAMVATRVPILALLLQGKPMRKEIG